MPDPASGPYGFDRVADEYDATRYLPPVIAARAAGLLTGGLAADDWFLDAGAGTGRLGRALTAVHPRTAGVDVSPAMLARFRAAAPLAARLALADLRALPFADGAFAGALTVHVLHLIPEWTRALAEIWRVLRPGGRLTLAYEDRSPSEVRERLVGLARERGLIAGARPGASAAEAAAALREWSGDVTERRPASLAWSRRATAQETLDLLARRTHSTFWEIPEPEMAALIADTAAWARARFGTERLEDVAETVDNRLALYTATKPLP